MIWLHVFVKGLKENFRRPGYLVTLLAIPMVFMVIFGAALPGDSSSNGDGSEGATAELSGYPSGADRGGTTPVVIKSADGSTRVVDVANSDIEAANAHYAAQPEGTPAQEPWWQDYVDDSEPEPPEEREPEREPRGWIPIWGRDP